jgi:hypothetical protein
MEDHTRQMCGSDRRQLADCRHTLGLWVFDAVTAALQLLG